MTDWKNRITEIRNVTAADLAPNMANWRRHPQNQTAALKGLLSEVGIVAPLIAYKNTAGQLTLIDGHLRRDTGGEWPCAILDVTEEEAAKILVSLDPLAAMAEADASALEALLAEVNTGDAGLQALLSQLAEDNGFVPEEPLQDAEPQIDRAEELRIQWGTELGQLWQLGEHRLICGDCTDAAVVERVMEGAMPNMIFADPPYGVNIVAANVSVGGGEAYDIPFGGVKKRRGNVGGGEGIKASPGLYPIQTWKKGKGLGRAKPFGSKAVRGSDGAAHLVDVGKYTPIAGDDSIDTAIECSGFYLAEYPHAVHIWWGGNYYAHILPPSSCWLVWNKETTGNFADCELAWTNQAKAARLFTHRWNGMLRDSERERRWHPTQKPAALAAWVFKELGSEGDIVLDPFLGSGPSLLAAQATSRKLRGIELSEEYIAVTLQRFLDATGIQPALLT